MSTASVTALPAVTVVEVIDELIAGGSISVGARTSAMAHLALEAQRRGFDPQAPIDGDAMDTLVVDAIPSSLWVFA